MSRPFSRALPLQPSSVLHAHDLLQAGRCNLTSAKPCGGLQPLWSAAHSWPASPTCCSASSDNEAVSFTCQFEIGGPPKDSAKDPRWVASGTEAQSLRFALACCPLGSPGAPAGSALALLGRTHLRRSRGALGKRSTRLTPNCPVAYRAEAEVVCSFPDAITSRVMSVLDWRKELTRQSPKQAIRSCPCERMGRWC